MEAVSIIFNPSEDKARTVHISLDHSGEERDEAIGTRARYGPPWRTQRRRGPRRVRPKTLLKGLEHLAPCLAHEVSTPSKDFG